MNTPLQKVHEKNVDKVQEQKNAILEDEFLNLKDLLAFKRDAAENFLRQTLLEISELIREKQWEDAVALCHPVEEKFPELLSYHLETPLREKIGFVLGQLKRFDEAIKELDLGIRNDPENFTLHSSLAYTAYNSLYAGKKGAGRVPGKRHPLQAQSFNPAGKNRIFAPEFSVILEVCRRRRSIFFRKMGQSL